MPPQPPMARSMLTVAVPVANIALTDQAVVDVAAVVVVVVFRMLFVFYFLFRTHMMMTTVLICTVGVGIKYYSHTSLKFHPHFPRDHVTTFLPFDLSSPVPSL